MRRLLAATLAVASLASTATLEAQIMRTGLGGGTFDAFWTATRVDLPGGIAGSAYSGQAYLANRIPSPPWAPNTADQQWISSSANGSTSPTGGVPSYRYFFTTTLQEGVENGVFSMLLGWDNRLVGAYLGGSLSGIEWTGGSSFLTLNPAWTGKSGFCRASDGVIAQNVNGTFIANNPEYCLVGANSNVVNASKGTSVTFVLEGDGSTDGFLLKSSLVEGRVVPEPASFALTLVGFAGLGAVARRRRSAN